MKKRTKTLFSAALSAFLLASGCTTTSDVSSREPTMPRAGMVNTTENQSNLFQYDKYIKEWIQWYTLGAIDKYQPAKYADVMEYPTFRIGMDELTSANIVSYADSEGQSTIVLNNDWTDFELKISTNNFQHTTYVDPISGVTNTQDGMCYLFLSTGVQKEVLEVTTTDANGEPGRVFNIVKGREVNYSSFAEDQEKIKADLAAYLQEGESIQSLSQVMGSAYGVPHKNVSFCYWGHDIDAKEYVQESFYHDREVAEVDHSTMSVADWIWDFCYSAPNTRDTSATSSGAQRDFKNCYISNVILSPSHNTRKAYMCVEFRDEPSKSWKKQFIPITLSNVRTYLSSKRDWSGTEFKDYTDLVNQLTAAKKLPYANPEDRFILSNDNQTYLYRTDTSWMTELNKDIRCVYTRISSSGEFEKIPGTNHILWRSIVPQWKFTQAEY